MLELVACDIDGEDPLRAAQQCALNHGEPDAAAADHGDVGALAHRRRPECGSGAGREAAGEQAACSTAAPRAPYRARLVHDRLVGERAAAQNRRQQRAVGGPVHPPLRPELRSSSGAGLRAGTADTRHTARATRRRRGRPERRRDVAPRPPRRRPHPRGRAGSGTASPSPSSRRRGGRSGRGRRRGRGRAPRAGRAGRRSAPRRPAPRRAPRRRLRASRRARRSCSSSGTSGSLKVSTALGVGDDVVAELEHRQLVRVTGMRPAAARSRPPAPASAERDMDRRPPHAERALQPLPELVPAHRVGAAELERPVRRGAARRSRARSTAARSSIQIGCRSLPSAADDRRHRREPREPARRSAARRRRGRRRSSAGRSRGRARTRGVPLHLPLRGEVRHRSFDSLVEPSALMSTNRRTPASFAAATRSRVPCAMTRSKSAGLPCDDRDEVDDGVDSFAGSAEGGRVGHVPGDELDAPRCERVRARRLPHERPHRRLARAQRVRRLRADEARPAGDEDRHVSRVSKFCQ